MIREQRLIGMSKKDMERELGRYSETDLEVFSFPLKREKHDEYYLCLRFSNDKANAFRFEKRQMHAVRKDFFGQWHSTEKQTAITAGDKLIENPIGKTRDELISMLGKPCFPQGYFRPGPPDPQNAEAEWFMVDGKDKKVYRCAVGLPSSTLLEVVYENPKVKKARTARCSTALGYDAFCGKWQKTN